MVRLIVLLAIVGVLTIFALQNTMPIALVIIGITTPPLPLSVWVLLAIAAGALTMATIAGLYRVSNAFVMPSAQRVPRRPTPPTRPSTTAGWQTAPRTTDSSPSERASRQSASASPDESWESFSQPLNDNWERSRRQEDWDDWAAEPEPEPVRRSYQPPYRAPASSSARPERREPSYDDDPPEQESRYDHSRNEDWRYSEPRDDDFRYEDSQYDEPRDGGTRYDDARDEDSRYGDSRYDNARSDSWYDRLNNIPVAEPVSRLADDDYLITFPDEDEEENASPQEDEWDDWEDDGRGAARTETERSPDPPSPPRRTEFERPQAPKATYRSGTVYSYKYRDRDPVDDEGEEAHYRVIIPPQSSTPDPSSAAAASDAASPNAANREDWSFMEDDDWRDRGDRPTV